MQLTVFGSMVGLVAKGFPYSQKTIRGAGYPIIEVDVSEFRKLDGGLSCLSLRFNIGF